MSPAQHTRLANKLIYISIMALEFSCSNPERRLEVGVYQGGPVTGHMHQRILGLISALLPTNPRFSRGTPMLDVKITPKKHPSRL